jgi:hypothetical protein
MVGGRGFLDFFILMYDIQHCIICRPSDSAVPEDAKIEPRKVATTALAIRRSNHSARFHPNIFLTHPHDNDMMFCYMSGAPTWDAPEPR